MKDNKNIRCLFWTTICMTLLFAVSCSKEKDDVEATPDIALNKSSLILEKGKTERLIASLTPANTPNKGHEWASSAPVIATVDKTGIVTAVSVGESIITATALNGGKTATCHITVTDKIVNVTSISLNKTQATLVAGDKLQLEAIILPNNATNKTIIWSSSDNKVASVNNHGVVTAIAEGMVTITAITADSEKSASCKINVQGKGIKISKPEITDITSASAFITGTIEPSDVEIQESGICYSLSQLPTINNQKVVVSDNNISHTLADLEPGSTYYIRIYAIIKGEVHYGEQATFTTTEVFKTHFKPTDIYEDKITLVSLGISGITSLKICYGTNPNPKITNNITTATVSDDGQLHLTLTNLKKGTTYYIRAYNLNGSEVDYYDNEVAVETVGGKFKVQYEASDFYRRYGTNGTILSYVVDLQITYDIKPVGTYLIETTSEIDLIKKGAEGTHSAYIENGKGSFIYAMRDGYSIFGNVSFDKRTIKFTNLENNIHYYISVGNYAWDLQHWF